VAGIFSRFFGSSVSVAAGVAIGGSVQNSLNPLTQALANDTWSLHPDVPPDAMLLAIGVAQGQVADDDASAWAAQLGYGGPQFTAMKAIADTGPGVAMAFDLWRRGFLNEAGFRRACKREALEPEWIDALVKLKQRLLSPAELANARQQEFIDDARLHGEGDQQGYDAERMDLLYKMAGLPPGVMDGLTMLRRGIISEATYRQLVAEGHTKTKYTDALLGLRDIIITPAEAAGLRLRGWKTKAESDALGALGGATPEVMENLYLNRGRPAAPVQMQTAWARGIVGPDGVPMNEAQFLKGIRESDIRPEWGPMLWGIRFAYPPLFQINRLVQQGAATAAEALDWATKGRYAPEVLAALQRFWAGAGTAGSKALTKAELDDEYEGGYISEADFRAQLTKLGYTGANLDLEVHRGDARRLKRWREKVVDAIAKAFIEHDIDSATAIVDLATVGVTGEAATRLVDLWQLEARVHRKHLTAAQVKRAYRRAILTIDQAVEALLLLDYTDGDARAYLAS